LVKGSNGGNRLVDAPERHRMLKSQDFPCGASNQRDQQYRGFSRVTDESNGWFQRFFGTITIKSGTLISLNEAR
jgi:hypothetical protein